MINDIYKKYSSHLFFRFFLNNICVNFLLKTIISMVLGFPLIAHEQIPIKLVHQQEYPSSSWAVSKLATMTMDEKIGQLFIAGAYASKIDAKVENIAYHPVEYIEKLISEYHIGGVLFKGRWDPLVQVHYVNHYQELTKIPLFVAQDLEWGLSMRLANTLRFPKNMVLGAIQNDELIYAMAKEVGRECHLIGVNMNFAPVVDVNCNPGNPVIGDRSFGDNVQNVARKGRLFIKGLQEQGILACAKHFPGHGDTIIDSHHALPTIFHTREILEQVDLHPFREAIEEGVAAVMVGHLLVPALDKEEQPATLSKSIVETLLKKTLDFQGLVVTDDMVMKAIAQHYSPGEALVKAFLAGNDLILSTFDIPEGVHAIKDAYRQGLITLDDIDKRVLKILRAKEHAKLDLPQVALEYKNLKQELFSEKAQELKRELYRHAVTIVRDKNRVLPLTKGKEIVYLQIGGRIDMVFYDALLKNSPNNTLYKMEFLPKDASQKELEMMVQKLADAHSIVIGLFDITGKASENFGINSSLQSMIQLLENEEKLGVLVAFGSPYSIKIFEGLSTVLVAYDEDPDAQKAAADVITGRLISTGRLPITP